MSNIIHSFGKKILLAVQKNTVSLFVLSFLSIANIFWLQANNEQTLINLIAIGFFGGLFVLLNMWPKLLKNSNVQNSPFLFLSISAFIFVYFCSHNLDYSGIMTQLKAPFKEIIFILKMLACWFIMISISGMGENIGTITQLFVEIKKRKLLFFLFSFIICNVLLVCFTFAIDWSIFSMTEIHIPVHGGEAKKITHHNFFLEAFVYGNLLKAIAVGIGLLIIQVILSKVLKIDFTFINRLFQKAIVYTFKKVVAKIFIPYILFMAVVSMLNDLSVMRQLGVFILTFSLAQCLGIGSVMLIILRCLKLDCILFIKKVYATLVEGFITDSSIILLPKVVDVSNEKLGASKDLNFAIQICYPFIMGGSIIYISSLFTFFIIGTHTFLSFSEIAFFIGTITYCAIGSPGIPAASFFITESLLKDTTCSANIWDMYSIDGLCGRICTVGNIICKYLFILSVNQLFGKLDRDIYYERKKESQNGKNNPPNHNGLEDFIAYINATSSLIIARKKSRFFIDILYFLNILLLIHPIYIFFVYSWWR